MEEGKNFDKLFEDLHHSIDYVKLVSRDSPEEVRKRYLPTLMDFYSDFEKNFKEIKELTEKGKVLYAGSVLHDVAVDTYRVTNLYNRALVERYVELTK